jgi:hypothetical protein
LEAALARKGWRVIAAHAGVEYRVRPRWEIQRSTRRPSLVIEFDVLDEDGWLPLGESYGCQVREASPEDSASSLYFRRPVKSRAMWEEELAAFVRKLDELDIEAPAARQATEEVKARCR